MLIELKKAKKKEHCIFTLEQANTLFPIVFRITKNYVRKVNVLLQRLNMLPHRHHLKLIIEIEQQKKNLIRSWTSKMKKLGVRPCCRSFIEADILYCCWVVEFDAGDGYFCWKYPEERICFWHGYFDGNSGRIPIETYLNLKQSKSRFYQSPKVSPT